MNSDGKAIPFSQQSRHSWRSGQPRPAGPGLTTRHHEPTARHGSHCRPEMAPPGTPVQRTTRAPSRRRGLQLRFGVTYDSAEEEKAGKTPPISYSGCCDPRHSPRSTRHSQARKSHRQPRNNSKARRRRTRTRLARCTRINRRTRRATNRPFRSGVKNSGTSGVKFLNWTKGRRRLFGR